jgi:hypothetical protein
MHIASALVVRRDRESINIAPRRARWSHPLAWFAIPGERATAVKWRKLLPGAVLLTALIAAGGLFPFLF